MALIILILIGSMLANFLFCFSGLIGVLVNFFIHINNININFGSYGLIISFILIIIGIILLIVSDYRWEGLSRYE